MATNTRRECLAHERTRKDFGYAIGIQCKNARVKGDDNWHVVTNLEEWYFYKNHIVGKYKNISQFNYFIFNETNCQHEIYISKKEFTVQLKHKGLKPLIWTRWHKENYGMIFTDGHILDKIIFVWIYMPVIVGFALFFVITLFRTSCNLAKKTNKINLLIVGIILLRIILDFYPQSL